MANRNFPNNKLYQFEIMPVLLNCNFVVDSSNGNGLGLRSLKGAGIKAVYMNTQSVPPSSPAMGTSRSYAILGASAVSNTGSSALTGNLGIFPGTAITGFPPGTFSGREDIANSNAQNAQLQALAAYTDLAARSSTVIPSALDGQTLSAGVYSFASGAATLAQSGAGTLTLNGSATDIFVIKTASTLTTGAGGTPTITLSGGALASNVYWVIGSSATINSGFAGIFRGNILALTSITDTLGGTVNGSLIALNGAVTLSAASIINTQPFSGSPAAGSPNPNPGYILVQFEDMYNRYLAGFSGQVSPLTSGSSASTSARVPNVIVALGTASLAQWQAAGLPKGIVPAIGAAFIPASSSTIGGSARVSLVGASGVDSIEVCGDPNQTVISPVPLLPSAPAGSQVGGMMVLQCLQSGVPIAPVDGSVVGLSFLLSNSSVLLKGE